MIVSKFEGDPANNLPPAPVLSCGIATENLHVVAPDPAEEILPPGDKNVLSLFDQSCNGSISAPGPDSTSFKPSSVLVQTFLQNGDATLGGSGVTDLLGKLSLGGLNLAGTTETALAGAEVLNPKADILFRVRGVATGGDAKLLGQTHRCTFTPDGNLPVVNFAVLPNRPKPCNQFPSTWAKINLLEVSVDPNSVPVFQFLKKGETFSVGLTFDNLAFYKNQ